MLYLYKVNLPNDSKAITLILLSHHLLEAVELHVRGRNTTGLSLLEACTSSLLARALKLVNECCKNAQQISFGPK